MKSKKHILFPKQQILLEELGNRMFLARKRRKLTAIQVAERAAIDRGTLRAIEQGSPSVSIGAFINVLRVLGLQSEVSKLLEEDPVGRKLQDLRLQNKD
ncbi:helix-turn-helix domain-containing protein [Chitinophaga pinensis]|uniref:Helix-turn-helix domain-containing protein n=1 Tax=Chitinophaga pinensis TaxID=79329 RepID=A0A5C6LP86_9BACT|nr:helix-turn-helix domain-containing protein [Chitinophaga pinensis]TWV99100.1 helix-turn-helix domain-containing protein [Chitinophaga pinensis]